jgi:hypothetical protein
MRRSLSRPGLRRLLLPALALAGMTALAGCVAYPDYGYGYPGYSYGYGYPAYYGYPSGSYMAFSFGGDRDWHHGGGGHEWREHHDRDRR